MSKKKEPVDWAARVAAEVSEYIETQGTLPWLKPWSMDGIFPTNLQTKHTYTGINALLLGMFMGARGYESPYFLTIKGMRDLGGTFTDWEADKNSGLPIVFWKMLQVDDKEKPGEQRTVPLLRGWTVWNVAHMEGITLPPRPEPIVTDIPAAVEGMMNAYTNPPRLVHEPSAEAYYSPLFDRIVLPMKEQFTSVLGYAETKAHELVHSTGHSSRLARFDDKANPHEAYAREELVAEIGAAIVMQRLGMEPDMRRVADYVQGWGRRIKDDPKMLVSAANRADRAANMVLGLSLGQEVAA